MSNKENQIKLIMMMKYNGSILSSLAKNPERETTKISAEHLETNNNKVLTTSSEKEENRDAVRMGQSMQKECSRGLSIKNACKNWQLLFYYCYYFCY